jgi:16S rRNA (cytosine1402-N4)-methyltransferase
MSCLPSWVLSPSEAMEHSEQHRPVLLQEALAALDVHGDGIYIDGTFGRGGHSQAILARLGPAGRLLAFDKDPAAVRAAEEVLGADPRFGIVRGAFSTLGEVLRARGWLGRVAGLLLDLGVSSPQLDNPTRGFSFLRDGPLDMRMDPDAGVSAAVWLKTATEQDIAGVLRDYGEERYAKRIARSIVLARRQQPIETTTELAAIVARAVPVWERDRHPATRSFQAIRIFLNHELEDLEGCLPQALDALAPGGRLVVISFHSLEDRIVKRFIRQQSRGDIWPVDLPIRTSEMRPRLRAVGGPLYPSADEQALNPRARSAVLRVAEKLA